MGKETMSPSFNGLEGLPSNEAVHVTAGHLRFGMNLKSLGGTAAGDGEG